MKVFMQSAKKNYDAKGEFDSETKELIVHKGSKVSGVVSESKTFRGGATVLKLWDEAVKDCIVTKDMKFKSASSAANFVTGQSTNGLKKWKTEKGVCLADALD